MTKEREAVNNVKGSLWNYYDEDLLFDLPSMRIVQLLIDWMSFSNHDTAVCLRLILVFARSVVKET